MLTFAGVDAYHPTIVVASVAYIQQDVTTKHDVMKTNLDCSGARVTIRGIQPNGTKPMTLTVTLQAPDWKTKAFTHVVTSIAPSGNGVNSGTFVTNENKQFTQVPCTLDADTFIFGATEHQWFKMTSVNAAGAPIESRYAANTLLSDILKLTPAIWANANRGGGYGVINIVIGSVSGTK